MNPAEQARQERRERLRWRCLKTVYYGGEGLGCSDQIILQVVSTEGFNCCKQELRRELEYLEKAELISITRTATRWTCSTTLDGAMVCEGNKDCPPGIRPEE
jgi:hypothetical protein